MNGAGQIVAAGTAEQLAALAADKPEGVRRVVPLKVAGAFHTHHMAPAVAELGKAAPDADVRDPALPYVSNTDGAGGRHRQRKSSRGWSAQVANPVRWDLCMETFKELGVTALIEVVPGRHLAGLAKRALPGVRDPGAEDPRRPRRGPRAHRRAPTCR